MVAIANHTQTQGVKTFLAYIEHVWSKDQKLGSYFPLLLQFFKSITNVNILWLAARQTFLTIHSSRVWTTGHWPSIKRATALRLAQRRRRGCFAVGSIAMFCGSSITTVSEKPLDGDDDGSTKHCVWHHIENGWPLNAVKDLPMEAHSEASISKVENGLKFIASW